jgi:hypothetical protein
MIDILEQPINNRLPRKGDRVRFWETEMVAGTEMRTQAEATVLKRVKESIYFHRPLDTKLYVTQTRKMDIMAPKPITRLGDLDARLGYGFNH